MLRTITASALALLLSGVASAQTEPPAPGDMPVPPAIDQTAPSAEEPLMPHLDEEDEAPGSAAEPGGAMQPGGMMGGDMMGGGMMGGDMMGHHRRGGPDGRPPHARGGYAKHHARHHRPGPHPRRPGPPAGAVFRFSDGAGGPSFVIRCAARDSTRDCAEAILPVLDRLMPQRGQ